MRLIETSKVINEMSTSALNEQSLNLAGWLSVIFAVLHIPYTIYVVLVDITEQNVLSVYLTGVLDTILLAMYVYVMIIFRRLLNQKASFHDLDTLITILIWATIAVWFFGLVTLPFIGSESLAIAAVVFLILLGILTVVYGVKLLSCDDALFGHLKMLAYLNIAGGILAGSVVLAVIAPIATAAAAVVAALVFFKSSKLIRDQGSLVS